MPQNFAGDADEYPLTIQAPADGDTANAASVATGLEQLADRTANLNARIPVALNDNLPADLGTAAAGVSSFASRADHVHNMPSAADVGALGATAAAGGDLSGNYPSPLVTSVSTQVDFSPQDPAPGNPAAGETRLYSTNDGPVRLVMKTPEGHRFELAHSEVHVVRNFTGAQVDLGNLVYYDGSQGNVTTIQKAIATAEATCAAGILIDTLANNGRGHVVEHGPIYNFDTTGTPVGEVWAEGDALYLSASVAGRLTKVAPSFPNVVQRIGTVIRVHASQGELSIDIQSPNDRVGWALRETGGPAVLAMGAVPDGYFLRRSGSTIVGAALSAADVTTGPLAVARGGTGLAAVGTAYQVLRTNSGATAIEWGEPNGAGFCVPNNSADFAASASLAGIPVTANATTGNLCPWPTTDRIFAMPWFAPFTGTRTGVIWELTTQDVGKVVNWALYESDEGGYPTTRVAAVSSVSLTGTGMKTNAFDSTVTVRKGRLYWLAWTGNTGVVAQARAFTNPAWSPLGFVTSAASLAFTSGGGTTPTITRVTVTYAVPPATFPTGAVFPGPTFPIVGIY